VVFAVEKRDRLGLFQCAIRNRSKRGRTGTTAGAPRKKRLKRVPSEDKLFNGGGQDQ